ncbi:MAG: hypothetical protein R3B99_17780 [Polyangiales bacterium]|nr:hypothetical protein [Myxococcales bacterium]
MTRRSRQPWMLDEGLAQRSPRITKQLGYMHHFVPFRGGLLPREERPIARSE